MTAFVQFYTASLSDFTFVQTAKLQWEVTQDTNTREF